MASATVECAASSLAQSTIIQKVNDNHHEHARDIIKMGISDAWVSFSLRPLASLSTCGMCAVRDLTYYMRLDVDSFLLRPLPYDPFRYLDDSGSAYGYLTTGEVMFT
jgi:hypothetical protein